jgi:hypothetical protein
MGSRVNGGLFDTARSIPIRRIQPSRTPRAGVHDETDFRSVYAQVIEQWLDASSVSIFGGDFRKPGLNFI